MREERRCLRAKTCFAEVPCGDEARVSHRTPRRKATRPYRDQVTSIFALSKCAIADNRTSSHLALRGRPYITFSMAARRVLTTLQARFSSMTSHSKNSSTLEEQEQKSAGTFDNDLPAIDKAKEQQLVRKLDLYIVPVVMLLYLFSFLDRSVFVLNSPLSAATRH
jgi:hypothetical protein